jgi:hypothetical protein
MEKLQLDYSAESGKNRKMAHLVNIACARFILVHQALHCNAALRPRLTKQEERKLACFMFGSPAGNQVC